MRSANAQHREVVSIVPQVSGKILTIDFTDGADVKKGDVLFMIDPAPYEATLHQGQANLAQSQADLTLATEQFRRAKELLSTHDIAPDDYDTRENAVAVAVAQIQANKAAIETAGFNLNYCTIRSPIDGRAGQRLVDVGNVVQAAGQMAGTSFSCVSGSIRFTRISAYPRRNSAKGNGCRYADHLCAAAR